MGLYRLLFINENAHIIDAACYYYYYHLNLGLLSNIMGHAPRSQMSDTNTPRLMRARAHCIFKANLATAITTPHGRIAKLQNSIYHPSREYALWCYYAVYKRGSFITAPLPFDVDFAFEFEFAFCFCCLILILDS